MGGGPFNVRPNCPNLESHFGTPPRILGPPPLLILGPPPPILRFGSHFGVRGPFKYGGGPFTVQIKDVSLWGGVGGVNGGGGIDRIWEPPPKFWNPPPPPLRFKGCFGVRGPFKYGGGPLNWGGFP